jgi:hypothetical protein
MMEKEKLMQVPRGQGRAILWWQAGASHVGEKRDLKSNARVLAS